MLRRSPSEAPREVLKRGGRQRLKRHRVVGLCFCHAFVSSAAWMSREAHNKHASQTPRATQKPYAKGTFLVTYESAPRPKTSGSRASRPRSPTARRSTWVAGGWLGLSDTRSNTSTWNLKVPARGCLREDSPSGSTIAFGRARHFDEPDCGKEGK